MTNWDYVKRVLQRRTVLGSRNVVGYSSGGYERAPDLVDWSNVELTFTYDDVSKLVCATMGPGLALESFARGCARTALRAVFPRCHFEEEQ